jgi:uncharacterized membrane-anchored protein
MAAASVKNKYNQFKHHAWAGLGALSLFFAVTRFFSVPDTVAAAVTIVLTIYAGTALVLTYRYRREWYLEAGSEDTEKKRMKDEEKIQKKKLKAELKKKKKEK